MAARVVREQSGPWLPPAVELVQSGPAGLLVRHDEAAHSCYSAPVAQLPAATNRISCSRAGDPMEQALALEPADGDSGPELRGDVTAGAIGWTISTGARDHQAVVRAAPLAGSHRGSAAHHGPADGRLPSAGARRLGSPSRHGSSAATLRASAPGTTSAPGRPDPAATSWLSPAADTADMLRVQLDDRAVFLARWQTRCCHCWTRRVSPARRAAFRR
jgi:hypothetical protein